MKLKLLLICCPSYCRNHFGGETVALGIAPPPPSPASLPPVIAVPASTSPGRQLCVKQLSRLAYVGIYSSLHASPTASVCLFLSFGFILFQILIGPENESTTFFVCFVLARRVAHARRRFWYNRDEWVACTDAAFACKISKCVLALSVTKKKKKKTPRLMFVFVTDSNGQITDYAL